MPRIALAVAKAGDVASKAERDLSGATAPRTHVFDDAFDPNFDQSILPAAGSGHVVPSWWRLAEEIRRRDGEYDGIVTWGEKLSLAMLMQQHYAGRGKPHIAMMYQFEKLNIRAPLSAYKRNLHAVVTWSSVQRRALIERLRYPAEKVYLVRHYVDQVFYSPRQCEDDRICAVGAEMRDYVTFKEAVRGTGIRCHIASDHVRIPGRHRLLADRRVSIEAIGGARDDSVTEGRMPLMELRDLYARSRFVVVPLMHSNTDNGVTVILEAMAMGKPVICSRTIGQVDVIEEGVTGLYVPIGDEAAMRSAILSLWNDPARAREMGLKARAFIEKFHTLEKFTQSVRSAAEASLSGRAAPETPWE